MSMFSEMRARLIRLGAQQRLNELNQERNTLLKLLDIKEKVSPRHVMDGVKSIKKIKSKKGFSYKGKHWTQTPAGRKRITAHLKRIRHE
jgi:hypothetical protein